MKLIFFILGTLLTVVLGRRVNFEKIITEVNSGGSTWTAGHNFDPETSFETLERMSGAIAERNSSTSKGVRHMTHADVVMKIPKEFDARKHWKKCLSIKRISDQGACKASWALAVSDAFTDRICIATKGKVKATRSAEHLLGCCTYCTYQENPCLGGYVSYSWLYIQNEGLPTGGNYRSKSGCQPYTIAPCKHTKPEENLPDCGDVPPPIVPTCKNICTNDHYKKKFDKDLRYSNSYYYFSKIEDAQKDILMYGPAVSMFSVFEDFYSYKKGVYQYKTGMYVGSQSVRVIGWGTEHGVDYWLIANSWNKNWGENGTFKIRRGTNECEIETNMSAATVR